MRKTTTKSTLLGALLLCVINTTAQVCNADCSSLSLANGGSFFSSPDCPSLASTSTNPSFMSGIGTHPLGTLPASWTGFISARDNANPTVGSNGNESFIVSFGNQPSGTYTFGFYIAVSDAFGPVPAPTDAFFNVYAGNSTSAPLIGSTTIARPSPWQCIEFTFNHPGGLAEFWVGDPISHLPSSFILGYNVYAYNHVSDFSLQSGTGTACNCTVSLPVELAYFNATTQDEESVQLDWSTLSELNNDYFEIYRSQNLENWTLIGTQRGMGNSLEENEYQMMDVLAKPGINYYKLIQYDIDGKATEHNDIASVYLSNRIQVHPNPFTESVTIIKTNIKPSEIALFDLLGNRVHFQATQSNKDEITLLLNDISSGVYLLRTWNEDFKIIKE